MLTVVFVEIIGHRGASFDAPENTLASLRLAFEQGADAVELDIHLTADNKIVIIHDPNTARTAGTRGRVADLTFEQLRQLDVGGWGKWNNRGFSEKISSLEQAMDLVPKGKRLVLEIKCAPEVLYELEKVLRRKGPVARQLVIIGFDYKIMQQARSMFPRQEIFWLVSRHRVTKKYPPIARLIQKAKAARLDGLNLECGFPINDQFASRVHAAGLRLYVWTVDAPELARRFQAAGVDGIATNRPGWLREQLASTQSSHRLL